MIAELVPMGRKKNPPDTVPKDVRKPYRAIRLREILALAAEQRAAILAQDLTQYANDAIRMRLESEGVWPPRKPE